MKQPLSFTDVLRFAAGYWHRQSTLFIVVICITLSASLTESYLPSALSQFLGAIRLNQDHAAILTALGIFLGAYVAQALLFSLSYRFYNHFETRIFQQIIDDAFRHILTLPERYFANTFTGSLVSKILRARQKMEVFEDNILYRIFPTFVILLASTVFLSIHFLGLALLLVGYLALLVMVSALLVLKVSGPAQAVYADAQDHFSANLADSISSVSTIKAYAKESVELARYQAVTATLRAKNLRAYLQGNITAFVQRMLTAGMLIIMMGGGTWYYFQGNATIENMAFLAFAYTIMQSYIRDVGENIKNLLTSSYDLHAVIRLLRETPEVSPVVSLPALNIRKGDIEFAGVTFTYPGKTKPIFDKLSVSIRAGERVALVGHSGGGKTTFIRLLQLLYQIQQGSIRIDGQDIASGSRESLRSAMALVPQDPILFHRSLRENIAYAKPTATFEEITRAAQQAHIDAFIRDLPEQYETLVGERGVKLSGGERQRIAIARAILADRPILILDEATSSLDSASEKAIQEALHVLIQGRTAIMIAHRLSTILDADRILVFQEGRVMEEGTHQVLLQRPGGVYAALYRLQSGGFIPE